MSRHFRALLGGIYTFVLGSLTVDFGFHLLAVDWTYPFLRPALLSFRVTRRGGHPTVLTARVLRACLPSTHTATPGRKYRRYLPIACVKFATLVSDKSPDSPTRSRRARFTHHRKYSPFKLGPSFSFVSYSLSALSTCTSGADILIPH